MPRRHHHDLHPLWIQKDFRLQEHPASGKPTAVSRVPTMLGFLGASLWKQWRDHELVDSRIRIQETGANLDRMFFQQFSVHSPRRRRDRDHKQLCAFVQREKISTKSMNGKLIRPSEERECAQRKLYEGEQKLRRASGRGQILTPHFRRTIKNLNLKDFSYTKQLDGQIRLTGTRFACVENGN